LRLFTTWRGSECTLCKEIGIPVDEFAAHCSCSELAQRVTLVTLTCVDCDFLDLVDGHGRSSPKALHDGLAADTLIDKIFDFL
jgi:hypothetical protein